MGLHAVGVALWLGILTSISPCPLATNIAAISFISRRVGSTRAVLLAGLLYTVGRFLVYLVLGALLVWGLLLAPGVSRFLQENMNVILGPVLILVGMFLLELLKLPFAGSGVSEKMQSRAENSGILGAGLLGIVFALSFCPISAALFFGSLIPLSLKEGSSVLLPSVYGVGTALPVIASALLLAFGAKLIGKVFDRMRQIELWARRITAILFILVGIYYSLAHIFEVL